MAKVDMVRLRELVRDGSEDEIKEFMIDFVKDECDIEDVYDWDEILVAYKEGMHEPY